MSSPSGPYQVARSVAVDRFAGAMIVVSLVFVGLWVTLWVLALVRGEALSAVFWGIPLALFLLIGLGWVHCLRPRLQVDESGISGLGFPRHLSWSQITKAFVWDDFLVVAPHTTGPYLWVNIRPRYPNNVYVRKIDPAQAEAITEAIKAHRQY